ncbi:hypothetical protein KI688_011674 [Linnemannia hyalina]|uniref:Uncharacterized protein n=1 Tax=Linnemannia hyalina TaxID=64524 RepID=A0A9P8BWN6_9FUNG|nr:hypothetical protein KI688_011674 [Linnemannia hyalina]
MTFPTSSNCQDIQDCNSKVPKSSQSQQSGQNCNMFTMYDPAVAKASAQPGQRTSGQCSEQTSQASYPQGGTATAQAQSTRGQQQPQGRQQQSQQQQGRQEQKQQPAGRQSQQESGQSSF